MLSSPMQHSSRRSYIFSFLKNIISQIWFFEFKLLWIKGMLDFWTNIEEFCLLKIY